jgi:mRNA interferase MazF
VVAPGPAAIVVMPFPFSDLSGTKLRPAVILADAGLGDWLLCQITSNPYSDPDAVRLTSMELQKGTLTL